VDQLIHKVLHYAVDWTGEDDPAPLGLLLRGGLKPEWLRDFDQASGRFQPSAAEAIFQIAALHLQQTGALVDRDTLGRRFMAGTIDSLARTLGRERNALAADASVLAGKAQQLTGNGSDVDYLVEEVKNVYEGRRLHALLLYGADHVGKGAPSELLDTLADGVRDIQTVGTDAEAAVLRARDVVADRWESYNRRVEGALNPAAREEIPTGFSEIDKRVLGFMPGEVVLVTGGTGLGKTLFRERLLSNLWHKGYNVIEVLAEFGVETSQFRLDAMSLSDKFGKGNGRDLKNAFERGEMTAEQREQYRKVLAAYETNPGDYFWVPPTAYRTLGELEPIIADLTRKHSIAMVGIDDLHNRQLKGTMRDDHLHQLDIIQWCKDLALRYKVVVVAECQEDKSIERTRLVVPGDVIKYSQKLAQKANVIIRLFCPGGRGTEYFEVQVLKHTSKEGNYSFGMIMDTKRMRISENVPEHLRESYR